MSDTENPGATDGLSDLKKRIARYDYYDRSHSYDARTFSYELRKTIKPKKTGKARKHALTVRRLIDERGRYKGTLIDIKSAALCDVLIDINEGVEGIDLSSNEPEVTPELMFFSYPGLQARLEAEQKKQERDENLISDIQAAIHVVVEDQGKLLLDMTKLTVKREISFQLLWAIFTPNSLVFQRHQLTEQDRVMLVRRSGYGERQDFTKYLRVVSDMIHDDGNAFGFARQEIDINEFRGLRSISQLPVYPLEYHPDKDTVYFRAVEQGKRFVRMPLHSYHEISGQAMRDPPMSDRRRYYGEPDPPEKFYSHGRVMISPLAFHRFEPNSQYNPTVHAALSKEDLSDNLYAICTPILLGFSFGCKSWGAFAMSRLQDVVWNDDAFRALVLGEKQKTLIHSLVRQHASDSSSGFDDIIVGKGRGLIGLLAGPPGSGKTLTAEAVAETTRRPLYAVSVGELGTTADTLEVQFLRVLELAQLWNAVLLLDEAEVFLQERNATDINRNALVSIFLRQLEYYQGILILTTNMAEQFDRAFESRIHFSVHYPELDTAAQRSIWATFFKKGALEVSDAELDELAMHHLNGRQIKNAFSSAQTIALANGCERLSIQDVQVVLGVLYDWQTATRLSVPLAR
ncbi:P-loop containing nucleoside triphosphate hydrolase protein [Auriculariales sp. MPI-PUGE-AT-0066]|nr:P-loop containing nucleoside triphosphate hydrolase protein [Auriculariales sp. MPI-PUGE-AT-0066]